jgi:hypothetical protein
VSWQSLGFLIYGQGRATAVPKTFKVLYKKDPKYSIKYRVDTKHQLKVHMCE